MYGQHVDLFAVNNTGLPVNIELSKYAWNTSQNSTKIYKNIKKKITNEIWQSEEQRELI